ncbi:MAG: hypothetical protein ACRECP_07020 [Methylocella sp.]
MIIDHLIANAKLFPRKSHSPPHYMNTLMALDDHWPRLAPTVGGFRSCLAGMIVTEARALAPAPGLYNLGGLLRRLKLAPHVVLKAYLKCLTAERS